MQEARCAVPTIDRSALDLLIARGTPRRRAAALLSDLDTNEGRLAFDEAAETSLRTRIETDRVAWITMAGPASWNGRRLRIDMDVPETLLTLMPGRRLGDVFEHPDLPSERLIETATRNDGILEIDVVPDVIAIDGETGSWMRLAAGPRRLVRRRSRHLRAAGSDPWETIAVLAGTWTIMSAGLGLTAAVALKPGGMIVGAATAGLVAVGTIALVAAALAFGIQAHPIQLSADANGRWGRSHERRDARRSYGNAVSG